MKEFFKSVDNDVSRAEKLTEEEEAWNAKQAELVSGGKQDKAKEFPIERAMKLFPSMGEANKYLAEDRIMCLQIYIKEDHDYYLTYIPDAKAVTDAPEDLLTLIKQRRRWQNGAFFAGWEVIGKFYLMANLALKKKKGGWLCGYGFRTKHGCAARLF